MFSSTVALILACAAATYLTRISGHLILSRFGRIHHRVEAALEAVPVAILTALVAPSIVTNGPAEALAILIAGLVTLRTSLMTGVAAGLVALVTLRTLLA